MVAAALLVMVPAPLSTSSEPVAEAAVPRFTPFKSSVAPWRRLTSMAFAPSVALPESWTVPSLM